MPTNPNFIAPTVEEMNTFNVTPNQPLIDASDALGVEFTSHGVPNEHTFNAVVSALQSAFNADPVSNIHVGPNGKLDEDGGYGPNTHDVIDAMGIIQAPPINAAPLPVPTVAPAVDPLLGGKPATPAATAAASPSIGKGWLLGGIACALVGCVVIASKN